MKATVSVPGKVHLMGEHAVVYGRPAVLAAVDMRLTATAVTGGKDLTVDAPEDHGYVKLAVENTAKNLGIPDLPGIRVSVTSDIPAGYHLGSSAAVAVAVSGAVSYVLKRVFNLDLINRTAYETEKKKHGNPSGGDNTAVCFGGFIWYRRELEFLKTLWQLPIKLSPSFSHFYLLDTGRPRESTGEMVSFVAGRVKEDPEKLERIFAENERQVKRVAVALKEGNEHELTDALKRGSRTLVEMGVVSPPALEVIRRVEGAGGAAKILGGGGRTGGVGFLLAYCKDAAALRAAAGNSVRVMPVTLGAEGVKLEAYE